MTDEENQHAVGASHLSVGLGTDGYWCVVCEKYLPASEEGVIVHDDVPHPEGMTFNEEGRPQ